MKLFKFISTIIIVLTILTACEPPAVFNTPQPLDKPNLSEFPNSLQGHYLNLEDSTVLIVFDKSIQRIYDFNQKIPQNQLDSNLRISEEITNGVSVKVKEIISRDGDSLVVHIYHADTLFQITNDNVVRKFKGSYFLNKRYDAESWEVIKIKISKGQLVFSRISADQDVESLRTITGTAQDTITPHRFEPTKKQFKEFVKNGGFSDSETFVKQKDAP